MLNAFREVEDNLADLRILDDQTKAQADAVAASERAARLSHTQYREGSIGYFDVIDADRTVQQQQRAAMRLDSERARSTVNLIGRWVAAGPWPRRRDSLSPEPARLPCCLAGHTGSSLARPPHLISA